MYMFEPDLVKLFDRIRVLASVICNLSNSNRAFIYNVRIYNSLPLLFIKFVSITDFLSAPEDIFCYKLLEILDSHSKLRKFSPKLHKKKLGLDIKCLHSI